VKNTRAHQMKSFYARFISAAAAAAPEMLQHVISILSEIQIAVTTLANLLTLTAEIAYLSRKISL